MNCAILLAAGKSERFGSDKLFALLDGRPVVEHALAFLDASRFVDRIWIVGNANNIVFLRELAHRFRKISDVVLGGATRFQSVKKALQSVEPCEYLIIHNAANPFASSESLQACITMLKHGYSGAAPARRITSTVKYLNRNQCETLAREKLIATETPQIVRYKDFHASVKACASMQAGHIGSRRADFTDDLSVLEAKGFRTTVVLEDGINFKITIPRDLRLAQGLSRKSNEISAVGFGEDSHGFERVIASRREAAAKQSLSSRPLILCGIKIPRHPALKSNSDGDVVLHALANALASSVGMGSLGTYATKACQSGGRQSSDYVHYIMDKVRAKNLSVAHCTISIEAARPKIDPYVQRMKKVLSKLLSLAPSHIAITAHTGEGLTAFGRGEGIACRVFLLIRNIKSHFSAFG